MLTFTAQGRIEVYLNGVLISRHVQEREAIESISRHHGIGTYEVIYPKVLVRKVERVSRETFVETGTAYGSGMAVEVVRRIVDTTAPTVGAMTASGMTATQVTLAWPTVSDSDFSYFELQKSTNGVNFGFLTTKITNTHTDTGLSAGSTYSYRYRIVDQSGNRSAFSAVISPLFPSVPSTPTVTEFTGTTITLDWPDNSHSVSGYRVYRSTDGSNYSLIASPSSSAYPDSGLSGATTYYYKVSAVTAYGESAQSSAVSQTTTTAGPDWIQNLPAINFVRGTQGQTFNFYPTYLNTNNNVTVTVESGTLPAEIRIVSSPTPQLAYDGTGTGSISSQVSFRVATSPEADWTSRSTASGVFYSHNFTYYDAAKTLAIASNANLHSSFFGVANSARVVWDTAIKLSGSGSCRLNMPASSPGTQSNCQISFAGLGASGKGTIKHDFYTQFAVYGDTVWRNFYYGASSAWGGKIAIIESADSSFDPGEVVIRRANRGQSGLLDWYAARSGTTSQDRLRWAAAGNEETIYNFYDLGTGTVSSLNTLQARYGPTYSDRNNTTADADIVASGAPVLPENGWLVVEVYIKQVSSGASIIKVWVAPYGQPPKLVFGSMDANLPAIGALDGASPQVQIYNGMQLLNYHNTATNWPSIDTYVCYDEVICSDSQINFPGGHSIPFPGSTTPTGYPPSGSIVVT